MLTTSRFALGLTLCALTLAVLTPFKAAQASSQPITEACTVNGIRLYGKVKVVEYFPDVRVKVVNHFPDLRVQKVNALPMQCGEWQFVNSLPDFRVKFVETFPDITIQYVNAFPGKNTP